MSNQIKNTVTLMNNNQTEIIRAISSGIIQCALFADKPEDSNPRVTRQAKQAAEAIASQFVGIIGDVALLEIEEAFHYHGYGSHPDCGDNLPWLIACGHDVWFTMRGHGVGFWDREELKFDCDGDAVDLADRLTEACRKLKHAEPMFYRGWMYIE